MTTNVTVTERAALPYQRLQAARNRRAPCWRSVLTGGGFSGFQYKFDTDRAEGDDDIVIERAGATVLIDPVSLNYMAGSRSISWTI